jgi:serine phosphatase RsbU (regulator of sigma subunit)
MPERRTLLYGLVVVALLTGTGLVSYLAYDDQKSEAMEADLELVELAASDARQDIAALASGLRGASGIVEPDGKINAARFKLFAREVTDQSPVLGLSWSPRVLDEDRAAFERDLGRPISRFGSSGGLVELEERNDFYLPSARTYPDTARRRELLGFDTLSDPERAAAAREAIDASLPRLSAPLMLAGTQEAGAAIYAPVTLSVDGEPRTVGLMISGVPGQGLADRISRTLGLEGDIAITDGGDPITEAGPNDGDVEAEVDVLGRRWQVSMPGVTSVDIAPAIALGVAGLGISLVAAALFTLASRRERELRRRQARTELQAARDSLLTRITESIEREIEVRGRLKSLARVLVPAVGDVCSVHEVTQEGAIRRVGVAALDSKTVDLINTLEKEPAETSPIRAAVTSREPVLYTRVAENREIARARERGILDENEAADASPEELLRADQRSNMIVPLVARGRVLGTISLSTLSSSGRDPLNREDLAFGMEVATHAAMALDNARLYEQQRDIAGILQQALLPRTLPEVAGAEVAVRHRPGRTGTEVGGDFYDLFEAGNHWVAVVGDVCGKGPEAAALTALVRHTLRATARLGPEEAVLRVHEAIQASGENTYCTLCCAELRREPDGLVARVATAGHPEPRIVLADGEVQRLEVTGPLVGILQDPVFEAQEVRLPAGSTFFMCSDGVPEARRNGEIFGDTRLENLLVSLSELGPAEMLHQLEGQVIAFVEGRPRDDLALFALRVND